MKKLYFIVFISATFLISCQKDNAMQGQVANCIQQIPAWCATVRCNPDGKPVCGCDKVTYGSVCEAQCAGVTTYTAGACK